LSKISPTQYSVSAQYGSIDGSWDRAKAEATAKARQFCEAKGQFAALLDTQQSGILGFTPQKTTVIFGCTYIRYINTSHPTQQQWAQDRYACLQETQQRVSLGAATSVVMPTCSAFNACLAARGYHRSNTANIADLNSSGSYGVTPSEKIQCVP
jgi:hypothetical protein